MYAFKATDVETPATANVYDLLCVKKQAALIITSDSTVPNINSIDKLDMLTHTAPFGDLARYRVGFEDRCNYAGCMNFVVTQNANMPVVSRTESHALPRRV